MLSHLLLLEKYSSCTEGSLELVLLQPAINKKLMANKRLVCLMGLIIEQILLVLTAELGLSQNGIFGLSVNRALCLVFYIFYKSMFRDIKKRVGSCYL